MPIERLQLPLPFPHEPSYDTRDFVPAASNQEALTWLDAAWPDRRLTLWGSAGCGKSHLMHIWAERSGARMLTGPTLAEQSVRDLDDMPRNGAVALDDADVVGSETLLLQLLNMARDRTRRSASCLLPTSSGWRARASRVHART